MPETCQVRISVAPNRRAAVYDIGERIVFHVRVEGDKSAEIKNAKYAIRYCGFTPIVSGELNFRRGIAQIVVTVKKPGTILAEVTSQLGTKQIRALGGAAVAPKKIRPALRKPADFDQFWQSKLKELRGIRANPRFEQIPCKDPAVDYFKLRLDNIRGGHIYAQLAQPNRNGKFPGLIIPQWAGVYGLPPERVVDRAKQGWLAINVMPHDLPFDKPESFYLKIGNTKLKEYWTIGNHSRETSYYLTMYLGACRSLEYLMQHPNWDGKTLAVLGASQGGRQAIMLAGLYRQVSALMALVPSGCDVAGRKVGRAIGFPNWADHALAKKDPRILETGRYFDPANFATNVRCRALIAMGLIDEVCPPAGIIAAINWMKGVTRTLILADSNHQGDGNAQAPFHRQSEQWLAKMVRGKSPPA